MKKQVLGIKIDDVSIPEVVDTVKKWLSKGGKPFDRTQGKHYIVTPNPEIVVMAQKDKELRRIINQADLAIPDGAGLKLAGDDIVCHTPGIDVMEELIKLAAEKGFTVGFLGGREEVAVKTAECLRKKYKNLRVNFADSGGDVDMEGKLLKSLKLPKTDLLFVAFGPPKQEKWIYKHSLQSRCDCKNLHPPIEARVMMGVGGAFDYLSGKVPRAPKLIRDLGFEWLFRLIIQPWRIKRQLALIKYLFLLTR